MARHVHHDPADADLYQAAEAAVHSGRVQHVRYKGATLSIGTLASQTEHARQDAEALTPAEREKILRDTFGAWKGRIDGERLKRVLRELQQDDASPRSL